MPVDPSKNVRRGRVPNSVKQAILAELDSGSRLTHTEVAAKYGVGRSYVAARSSELNATHRVRQGAAALQREAGDFPDPIPLGDLSAEAERALEDIEFFAQRYYGIQLLPWQVMAAQRIVDLLATPYEEFAVINAPPGSGKTAFFGRVLPAWLTVRDRAMRGLVGSATQLVAKKIVDLLRRDFTKAHVEQLTERDIRQGLVQADSVLARDFGRLRPDVDGHEWTRASFEVAQLGDRALMQKEPTWQAFGKDTTFIGMRVDFALWDDVWDPRAVRSSDAKEDFFTWFDDVAEARIEPGGLFLLQGQRLAPDDVYRYALDKTDDLDEDDLSDFEVIEGGAEDRRAKKYHHIVFKAYDPTKDTGDPALLRADAPPWPEGPLLSPFRIKWRKLRQIRANTPDTFALVYQQEDHELAETLVNPLWIKGGVGTDGEVFPGCRDDKRALWELPEGLAEPVLSVASTDPSHTKYWANHWYLWQPAMSEGDADLRHVMALEWKKMQAPDFLEFNATTGTWSGLMEDWWQISNELGRPIRYWIVEQNGAQRYLLQYDHVRRWMSKRQVRIIGHTTGTKKKDPDLGVQTLSTVYRRGQIRLPMADAMSNGIDKDLRMLELIKQVTQYPAGTYDDIPMSQWFFEANKDLIRPRKGAGAQMNRPGFMSRFERKEVAA